MYTRTTHTMVSLQAYDTKHGILKQKQLSKSTAGRCSTDSKPGHNSADFPLNDVTLTPIHSPRLTFAQEQSWSSNRWQEGKTQIDCALGTASLQPCCSVLNHSPHLDMCGWQHMGDPQGSRLQDSRFDSGPLAASAAALGPCMCIYGTTVSEFNQSCCERDSQPTSATLALHAVTYTQQRLHSNRAYNRAVFGCIHGAVSPKPTQSGVTQSASACHSYTGPFVHDCTHNFKQCYLHSLLQPAMLNAVAADGHNRSVPRWCCSWGLSPATVPYYDDTNDDVGALSTGMPVQISDQGTGDGQAEPPRPEFMLSATHKQQPRQPAENHMLPLQPLAHTSLEYHQMLGPSR